MKLVYVALPKTQLTVVFNKLLYPASLLFIGLPQRHKPIRKGSLIEALEDARSRLGGEQTHIFIFSDVTGDFRRIVGLISELPANVTIWLGLVTAASIRNADKLQPLVNKSRHQAIVKDVRFVLMDLGSTNPNAIANIMRRGYSTN